MADAFGATLLVMHVIAAPIASEKRAIAEAEAKSWLAGLLDDSDRVQRHATVDCVFGTPGCEIARYATEHGADLIVMGTHSHGPTFQMATGSIAELVMGLSPCLVLAVKAEGMPATMLSDPPGTVAHL